jgi:Na+/proline symporter
MLIAAVVTVAYTYVGGMWSVSLNDTIQMGMIVVGMIAVTIELVWKIGFHEVIAATPPEYFRLSPGLEGSMKDWLAYVAAWITIGLGSIPQQDVYQRTMSAKTMKISVWASVTGGLLYFVIVMMPLFFGLVARMLHPELLQDGADPQLLIPTLILSNVSFVTQVIFLGALIAAVKSTASAAILAPATLFAENVVKPFVTEMSDRARLHLIRYSIVAVAAIALLIAIQHGNIFDIVSSSYSITLVCAFVPLAAGLFSKRANTLGAMLAIVFGALTWQYAVWFGGEDPAVPGIITGLLASVFGMALGIILEHSFHPKHRPRRA